jgi:hypothetical protein
MLDPQKTFERETLLRRYREIRAELAQIGRNLREGEARLPVAEQLRLNLRRLIESKNITELAGASIDIVDNTVTLRPPRYLRHPWFIGLNHRTRTE